MPSTTLTKISDLKLDLGNFRTVRQQDEAQAVHAMISISPDRFWALMESLLDDGYLPTENILVLKSGGKGSDLVVKEGNRRIAALKIVFDLIPGGVLLPDSINKKIDSLDPIWRTENEKVPCTIFDPKDAAVVDRIVTLAHGKGEKAGRDQWSAVARARHNRDILHATEPALDLLEKYLKTGRNLSPQQAERWAGDYPLSVLDEAMKKIAPLCGVANAPDLGKKYPKIQYRDALDEVIKDIALQIITFTNMRKSSHNFAKYGFPYDSGGGSGSATGGSGTSEGATGSSSKSSGGSGSSGGASSSSGGTSGGSGSSSGNSAGTSGGNTSGNSGDTSGTKKNTAAVSIDDPRAVARVLKKFIPRGNNRDKVVTLREEIKRLKIKDNPIAFCFLLRSMFEISAKAYCEDHKGNGGAPTTTKADGSDRALVDVLRDVTSHLTKNKADKAMVKVLHGALTELSKPEGLLSVTSMNQLVHNPKFSVTANDICILFGNVYPLLEAMN